MNLYWESPRSRSNLYWVQDPEVTYIGEGQDQSHNLVSINKYFTLYFSCTKRQVDIYDLSSLRVLKVNHLTRN